MQYFFIVLLLGLSGCIGIPDGIEPIQGFEVNRYLGKWYEIARLDHTFERGLQRVTADYSMRKDGGIKVINRGFDQKSHIWDEAEGKAYFVKDTKTGHLKVSFFGPFYASYIIFGLGNDYEYSLVTSSNRSYLWLLSRTPVIDETLKNDLTKRMADLGFEKQSLIFVEQTSEPNIDNKYGG
ncbi:MAG: apolipoprotein D and lipocalin family protein [Porticoccus sp.]|jgi:apolipoprotein D and lipocalin family protein